jgi:hypothetical protein
MIWLVLRPSISISKYKSLFKTFLTENKDILSKSPTDGVVAAPSKASLAHTAQQK